MFGIGKKTKEIARRTQHKAKDTFIYKKEAVEFFKSLEASYYSPDYFFDIVPEFKIVFVQVPKAGSSTVKLILSRAAGGNPQTERDIHKRKTSCLLSPRMYGLNRFYALLNDPAAFIFTVTRHPLERLLSCYKDKFLPYKASEQTPYNKEALALLKGIGTTEIDPGQPLPLEAFLRMACNSNYARINGHWSAMSDIVPIDKISFTHIGRLSEIGQTMDLLKQRGLPSSAFPETAVNQSKQPKKLPALDLELANLVNQAYAADFRNFGYSPIGQ